MPISRIRNRRRGTGKFFLLNSSRGITSTAPTHVRVLKRTSAKVNVFVFLFIYRRAGFQRACTRCFFWRFYRRPRLPFRPTLRSHTGWWPPCQYWPTRENKRRGRISGEPAADDEERRDTDEKEETQESVVHGFRPERVGQRQITR